MQKTTKSLSTYIMDENHFKDFEYEFDYCIIRKENDFDYLGGTLTSALAEFMTFKDNESLAYFLALLLQIQDIAFSIERKNGHNLNCNHWRKSSKLVCLFYLC